jgi:hypothetical protein
MHLSRPKTIERHAVTKLTPAGQLAMPNQSMAPQLLAILSSKVFIPSLIVASGMHLSRPKTPSPIPMEMSLPTLLLMAAIKVALVQEPLETIYQLDSYSWIERHAVTKLTPAGQLATRQMLRLGCCQ